METTNAGLRERKKQKTRDEISAVATMLFAERGFERVTIAEVAAAAEVAKMTVTNHFPLKEDLVFDRHAEMTAGLAEAVGERRPGESVPERVQRAYAEGLERGDPTLGHLGVGFARLVEGSPALQAREQQIHGLREAALAEALIEEFGSAPDDLTPRIVAAQLAGVYRILYYEARRRLLAGQDPETLRARLAQAADSAFGLLRADLGGYGRLGTENTDEKSTGEENTGEDDRTERA